MRADAVKTGDVLLEITTIKLTNEVTSEHDGVLLKIVAGGRGCTREGPAVLCGPAR